jgi:7-cyano-7-deazaguanine synthase
MKKEKAVCIISGGLDSITLLYWAKQKYQDIEAINFKYGAKHNDREATFADYHCKKLDIPLTHIELDFTKWGYKSALLKTGDKIPEGHYEDENMKQTVVPFRNGIMLSIAVGYAENIGAEYVMLGSHKGDRSIYPDCRSEFTQAISLASQLGTYKGIKIISPFNDLTKWEVLEIGLKLGIDYSKTWSCYNGLKRPCLKCGTCVERTEAFYKNNINDPLLSIEEWVNAVNYAVKTKAFSFVKK